MKSLVQKFAPRFVISLASSIIERTNSARFSISQFLEFASREVQPSDRVLDAGAGSRLYRPYFVHATYESTDFSEKFSKPKDKHTFICDLHCIPVSDNSYDAIVNIQVLEHVEHPQKVIDEFYRVLKPAGRLFLTAPQGWKVHMAPYHFFNFTRYGLESLFKNAGFEVEFIKPKGGVFCYLASIISKLPRYLFDECRGRVSRPFVFGLYPFYALSIPICEFVVPLLFFYLDRLDRKREFTLGYVCYCRKMVHPEAGP